MASNRHLGRIIALQTLYEYDFRAMSEDTAAELKDILDRNIDRYQETVDDKSFIRDLVDGVAAHSSQLDDTIRPIAPEWPVEQIARVDKIILRIALFELTVADDVPPKVVINEAVELGKSFGGDNSSKFINGVLGTAYRQKFGENSAKKATKPAAKPKKKPGAKPKKKTAKE